MSKKKGFVKGQQYDNKVDAALSRLLSAEVVLFSTEMLAKEAQVYDGVSLKRRLEKWESEGSIEKVGKHAGLTISMFNYWRFKRELW